MTGRRMVALAAAALGALALPWALRAPGGEASEGLSPALRSLRAPAYDPRFGLEDWSGRLLVSSPGEEASRAVRFCRRFSVEDPPNCRAVLVLDAAARLPGFLDRSEVSR